MSQWIVGSPQISKASVGIVPQVRQTRLIHAVSLQTLPLGAQTWCCQQYSRYHHFSRHRLQAVHRLRLRLVPAQIEMEHLIPKVMDYPAGRLQGLWSDLLSEQRS